MKLLVLNPFGATEPYAEENLKAVKRDDVEFIVENISKVFPLNYNTFRYNLLKCANGAVERIIKAEREGYDGVLISCQAEPGLYDARAVVDIPVTGSLEASLYLACTMGRKFSIIATDQVMVNISESLVLQYGLLSRSASIRPIHITANRLYSEFTSPEELQKRTVDVGRKCIDDGAEVLIPGCTILGAILNKKAGVMSNDMDVPVIDPMVAGFKQLEMMVDLQKRACYPAVSRIGFWHKQPENEYEELRKWLRKNKSPEEYYQQ